MPRDHALVAQALMEGDKRAFEQLVRRHQGMVRAQLRRLTGGDESLADDLAQETFLLAWRKLHQFRGEAHFSTWLYRIAYSRYLQACRKRPAIGRAPEGVTIEEEAAHPASQDLRLDVQRALRLLSSPEQLVLLHVSQMGLAHEEAAYVLGMPLGTVKSHARRGKAKLRAILEEWRETSGTELGA